MVGQTHKHVQIQGPYGSLDPGQYTSLALTHVQYHPDDPFSMPLSLITLAPPFLLVSYVTLILVRRELSILIGLVGQLGCEGLNLALKRIFKQGRPTDFLGTGYGMPSSHSQFMGYFMAFWCIHLYRFRPGRARTYRAKELGQSSQLTLIGALRSIEHFAVVLFIVLLSLATAYSRYHLVYHTSRQIFVGFSVGAATGVIYNYVFEILLGKPILNMQTSLRQWVLDNPISIALRIRDSWAVWDDGGIEGEYGYWRREWQRRKAEGQVSQGPLGLEDSIHLTKMLQALHLASQCEETTAAFSVGCVITVSASGEVLSTGYSRQEPGNTHAEEVALDQLASKSSCSLQSNRYLDLDLYTTMEPCSERLSGKMPCTQRILEFNKARFSRGDRVMRIARIFQGVQEPEDFVKCVGTRALQQEGLQVTTVQGPTKMRRISTGEQAQIESGWIEREALRLAKKGHPDQKKSRGSESRLWKETGWLSIAAAAAAAAQPSSNHVVEKKKS